MTHTPTYLYHWTHVDNLSGIMAHGLSPTYARGRVPRVYAGEEGVAINLATHIARSHGWEFADMACIRVSTAEHTWHAHGSAGIHYSWCVIPPCCLQVGTVADVETLQHGQPLEWSEVCEADT